MDDFECACMGCGVFHEEMVTVCPECESTDIVTADEYQEIVDGTDADF